MGRLTLRMYIVSFVVFLRTVWAECLSKGVQTCYMRDLRLPRLPSASLDAHSVDPPSFLTDSHCHVLLTTLARCGDDYRFASASACVLDVAVHLPLPAMTAMVHVPACFYARIFFFFCK